MRVQAKHIPDHIIDLFGGGLTQHIHNDLFDKSSLDFAGLFAGIFIEDNSEAIPKLYP